MWRQIFSNMCRGTISYGHIKGTSKPTSEDDEEWHSVDAHLKAWFYSICDPELLQIISRDDCKSKDLWDKIEELLFNNKIVLNATTPRSIM